MRRLFAALLLVVGCSFDENGTAGDGSAGLPEPPSGEASVPDAAPSDAASDAPSSGIPHLPPGAAGCGTGDLQLGTQTIDTTNLTLGNALPAGVTFAASAQSPSGPELAVLHARGFSIPGGATVRVVGSRPLVIVACGDVTIDGKLDASAAGATPGAGGAASNMGAGAGSAGQHVGMSTDSGGGGAGFATAGGSGGDASGDMMLVARGGAGGAAYDDASQRVLQGGSGGGLGSSGGSQCTTQPGGAGGGAIQIFSTSSIHVAGGINAGGGGGAAGAVCGMFSGAGSGGGSGGSLYLQAPSVTIDGTLAANGGGGGGAGSGQAGGQPGQNGGLDNQPAPGGASGGPAGSAGGNGAAATTAPGTAPNADFMTGSNSGGGGGSVGRIRILTQGGNFNDNGTISPPPDVGTY